MSRTYRKFPCFGTDGPKHRRFAKRQANKRVRKSNNVTNGGAYKKLYCSYDIVDFKWVYYTDIEILDSINEFYTIIKPWKLKSRSMAGS